ncbi:MAG: hypothetical protein IPK07_13635 [Deltaproteobacteria bacterium]|nr:hypothetical protein [Deltaproteobacteria bacterium]
MDSSHPWIEQQRFTDEYATMTFDTLIRAVTEAQQMLADLDAKLEAAAQREPYATPVRHLRCFRSFDTVTALSVVAELYGFLRFESATLVWDVLHRDAHEQLEREASTGKKAA